MELTIEADTVLAASSPTISQVLSERKVNEVPIVGNNVLDMLNVLGGLDNLVFTSANPSAANAFGRQTTTLAGVSAGFTPMLRDGVMVQDRPALVDCAVQRELIDWPDRRCAGASCVS